MYQILDILKNENYVKTRINYLKNLNKEKATILKNEKKENTIKKCNKTEVFMHDDKIFDKIKRKRRKNF